MPRIDDYKAAIALAAAELKKLNPKRLASRSRGDFFFEGGQEGIILPYFGQGRRVSWPEIKVAPVDGSGDLPLTEQILILHYLLQTTGEALTGKNIDFRQVPEGSFYWSAFVSRAKKPLLETFGSDLELYLQVAAQMGGSPRLWGTPQRAFWPSPWFPSPMCCGGGMRNSLRRPTSCLTKPLPGICPPRTSPPWPGPRFTG